MRKEEAGEFRSKTSRCHHPSSTMASCKTFPLLLDESSKSRPRREGGAPYSRSHLPVKIKEMQPEKGNERMGRVLHERNTVTGWDE